MFKRLFMFAMISALAGSASEIAVAASPVRPTISRAEHCNALNRQLDDALKSVTATKQATAARALQKKAAKLCSERKQAQGIRTYAKALKLLGIKPIDS